MQVTHVILTLVAMFKKQKQICEINLVIYFMSSQPVININIIEIYFILCTQS